MKSKLFSTSEFTNSTKKRFREDLLSLLNSSDKVINEAISLLPKYIEANKPEEVELISKNLSEKMEISQITVMHLFSILSFFSKYIVDDNFKDDANKWSEDLVELELLEIEKVHSLDIIFDLFSPEIKTKILQSLRKDLYRKGVLPYFSTCETTIEDRYVLDKDYKYSGEIGTYKPEILCKIPIISIHISTDMKNDNGINFQASPEDVQYIINKLYSALLVIKQAENK